MFVHLASLLHALHPPPLCLFVLLPRLLPSLAVPSGATRLSPSLITRLIVIITQLLWGERRRAGINAQPQSSDSKWLILVAAKSSTLREIPNTPRQRNPENKTLVGLFLTNWCSVWTLIGVIDSRRFCLNENTVCAALTNVFHSSGWRHD